MYPRSGFRSEGTGECTLVPVFVPGEHPPKPPFCKTTLLSTSDLLKDILGDLRATSLADLARKLFSTSFSFLGFVGHRGFTIVLGHPQGSSLGPCSRQEFFVPFQFLAR